MAEVNVVKPTKPDVPPGTAMPARWRGFETPFNGGSFFNMNPFGLMRQFTDEMDRMFHGTPRAFGEFVPGEKMWSPVIEVKEKEGKLFVTADLPGLKREDVKVRVENGTLFLEGERKRETEEKRDGYYHSERAYGSFFRSIPLPETAKADETVAAFHNGVLEVTIPVPGMTPTRKEIPVC